MRFLAWPSCGRRMFRGVAAVRSAAPSRCRTSASGRLSIAGPVDHRKPPQTVDFDERTVITNAASRRFITCPAARPARCAPSRGRTRSRGSMPRMLLDIQNRGQLSAGMTTFNPDRNQLIDTYKELGGVSEVFRLSHRGKAESLMQRICRPGRHRPCPLCHLRLPTTAATPSRSSGTTCKSTSGSASPSTASWPTIRSCARTCWPTTTTIWPATPTPKSSCTRSAASCRATAGRRWST